MSYDLSPPPISPLVRLFNYDDKEWELFIEECVDELKKKNGYIRVVCLGGAGDKGRDICAYRENQDLLNTWDLYQAKHYSVPINQTNFFPELAKFFDMLITKQYQIPKNYFLCALKVGSKVHDLFLNKVNFKKAFSAYVKKKNGVFPTYKIVTDLDLFLEYIESFDFSILDYIQPKDLLEIHKDSIHHWRRFGELPPRENDPEVPEKLDTMEEVYINELIRLYNDYSGENYTIETLTVKLKNHLHAQRKVFFMAEGLNRFSRDKLPNQFDNLLGEILVALEVLIFGFYPDNMVKFEKLISYSSSLKLTNNPLTKRLKAGDLSGCCHHLVNRKNFTWIDDE